VATKPKRPEQPLDRLHGGPPLIMSPLAGDAAGTRTRFDPLTETPPVGVPTQSSIDAGLEDDDRVAETTTTAVARSRRPRALKGDR